MVMVSIININWKYVSTRPTIRSTQKNSSCLEPKRISIMAVQYSLTHPGLDRLGRSYDAVAYIAARTVIAVRGWQGWARLASAYEAWALARVEAIALQDPRVRAEIQAAAQRMTSDDVR